MLSSKSTSSSHRQLGEKLNNEWQSKGARTVRQRSGHVFLEKTEFFPPVLLLLPNCLQSRISAIDAIWNSRREWASFTLCNLSPNTSIITGIHACVKLIAFLDIIVHRIVTAVQMMSKVYTEMHSTQDWMHRTRNATEVFKQFWGSCTVGLW